MIQDVEQLIPEQVKGKANNIETSKSYSTRYEAVSAFEQAFARLNDPLHWHLITRTLVVKFLLPDDLLKNRFPLLTEGNFFRIEIPGPGAQTGEGYDWVKVDKVVNEVNPDAVSEFFAVTFRACSNPDNPGGTTAHFFQSQATSTFLIQRNCQTVTTSYHGRNEIPNTHTPSLLGNIRNAFVALGAAAGLSDTFWRILIESFLSEDVSPG